MRNYLDTGTGYVLFGQVAGSRLYVDKSMLIGAVSERMGSVDKYLCITRPRRFGKTVNANMLAAFYTMGCDSRGLFEGLGIASCPFWEEHLNRHHVIHVDFSRRPDVCRGYEDYIRHILSQFRQDFVQAYPHIGEEDCDSVYRMLRASGDSFVFVLDEWDSVFYEPFMRAQDKKSFLNFLKALLKDQPYVELAYMTGVLPIAKYSSGSELNMFDEYNVLNDSRYDEYFGFREAEVRSLCGRCGTVSYEELKLWYDGYHFSDGASLFNPRSVSRALDRGECLNYWTETGPMNEIADCIEHNVDEVREDIVRLVAGIPVETELSAYSAVQPDLDSRDEILSAMVVYGFLSYHDGCLSIPNQELMEKFRWVLSRDSMGEVKEIVECSREVLKATLDCDGKRVAELLEAVHDREIPFLQYGDENALSCVVTLCYLYARKDYWVEREEKSGKGYCDYFFHPKKNMPAIIVELKVGKSCQEALLQIKEKDYLQKARRYGEALLVGICYDEKKHHECKIERAIFS